MIVHDTYRQDGAWSGVTPGWVGAADAATEGWWVDTAGQPARTVWLGGRPSGDAALPFSCRL